MVHARTAEAAGWGARALAALLLAASGLAATPPAAGALQTPLPATVRSDCAPWDGPAFTITAPLRRRSGEPPSVLTIAIWKPAAGGTPLRFLFPRDGAQGAVTVQPRPGVSGLLAGEVSFVRLRPDQPVEGRFDLVAPDGRSLRGRFRAMWDRGPRALCG